MQPPPNMPQFGQAPIIGQRQQHMQAQVEAAIGQVSLGIYSQLATSHIGMRDEHQSLDQDKLRQLAKDALIAARCYFEGLGVVKAETEGDKT